MLTHKYKVQFTLFYIFIGIKVYKLNRIFIRIQDRIS